jgi:mRNA interferase MazF
MERFVKSDVVVLPLPYTDFSDAKKRPALIVANLKGKNTILVQITKINRNDDDIISLGKKDFVSGFLKEDSFVMPSMISTVRSSLISYKVGRIKKEKLEEIERKMCEIFTR